MRVLLLLLALLPGCLAPEPDGNDGSVESTDEEGRGLVTSTQELGRTTVSTPGPGSHSFTVDVPAGGATNVGWTLTIEGPNVTSTVNGHGCSSNIPTNISIAIGIGASNTKNGSCDDLPAGPAEFTVMLTDPALSFTAIIHGSVSVES